MFSIFFFNDTATTEIYTLSLHDALPIYLKLGVRFGKCDFVGSSINCEKEVALPNNVPVLEKYSSKRTAYLDRKSTRLNSSHSQISYAVFCLKKKKTTSDGASTRAARTSS